VRTAVGHDIAGALALAESDRAAVPAGSLEQTERQRIDVRDRERLGVVGGCGELGGGLEAAEEVRLLEDDGRRVLRRGGERVWIGWCR